MIHLLLKKSSILVLVVLLLLAPFTGIRADTDVPSITDPITGIQYTDHPPPELLKGKSEQDQSRLLEWWVKEADEGQKSRINEYYLCQRELLKAKEQLAGAESGIAEKTEEYKKARLVLNRRLVGLIYQMGLTTGVIMTDAAVDFYLAGRAVKEAIRESSKHKERRITEADQKVAQEKTNLASKRDQFVKSLEESFNSTAQGGRTAESGKIPGAVSPKITTGSPPTRFGNMSQEEVVRATGPAEKAWWVRPGEGTLPESARVGKPGQKLVLDPGKGRYVWVIRENGAMVYAPQFETVGGVVYEVKHTDLAQKGLARIGGELIWDEANGVWIMNNNSGRYSFRPTDTGWTPVRSEANMEAAYELAKRTGTDANIKWEWKPEF